jgi:hypothetical protein
MNQKRESKSDKDMLVQKRRRIERARVEAVDPNRLFNSIVVSDDVDFTDPHSLRRAFRA